MSEELKPCPFCGADASVYQFESNGGNGRMIWIVGCENPDCEVTFHGHARKVDAKKAWNTRNDRAVIDGFLAKVRDFSISKGHQQEDLTPIVILRADIDAVYAETFGRFARNGRK